MTCGECGRRPVSHVVQAAGWWGRQSFSLCELCAHVVAERLALAGRSSGYPVALFCCGRAVKAGPGRP